MGTAAPKINYERNLGYREVNIVFINKCQIFIDNIIVKVIRMLSIRKFFEVLNLIDVVFLEGLNLFAQIEVPASAHLIKPLLRLQDISKDS